MRPGNDTKTVSDNLLQPSTVKTALMPWPHQEEALAQLEQAASEVDRITMVLACGSGKTVLALWFAERLRYQRILILLPSLGLLSQTLHEWLRLTEWQQLSYLCVCCDAGVSREVDAFLPNQSELDFTVTTDAQAVQQFLSADCPGVQLVFSTYQSAPVVAAGMQADKPFDLTIFDEAHKTAGLADHLFAFALEDKHLPSKKRLFMTATPRQYVLKGQKQDPELICSMDSPELYGNIHYHLSFAKAVEQAIICNYQVIIPVVTSNRVNALALHDGKSLLGSEIIPAETLAHYIALQDAVEKQGIQKILTFHSRVEQAKDFKRIGKKIGVELLPGFQFFHINGEMSARQRTQILRNFAKASAAVLTNARCLTEGIDIPNVDLVAFLSPKHSHIDIVQAAGRAMRKVPGKKQGYVLVPLYVELSQHETIEDAVLRLDYSDIWETLYALAEYDEFLASSIRAVSQKFGETGKIDSHLLQHKILIETPLVNAELLQQSIMTLCLEKLHTSWDKRYGELVAYKKRFGHCDVPYKKTDNVSLALWVLTQRKNYRKGILNKTRIDCLNRLGFHWGTDYSNWDQHYLELKNYKEKYGHCKIAWNRIEHKPLMRWLAKQRAQYRQGHLSQDKIDQLNHLEVKWSFFKSWDQFYQELKMYKADYGDCDVPFLWKNNPLLANWVRIQRSRYSRSKLDKAHIALLNKLSFNWKATALPDWQTRYRQLLNYKEKYGDANVPHKWRKNPALANWVATQRNNCKDGKLTAEKIDQLNQIGFRWRRELTDWQQFYNELAEYTKKQGHCNVPHRWADNKPLSTWLAKQRRNYRRGLLTPDKIVLLEDLGIWWSKRADWQKRYYELINYKQRFGDCNVPHGWIENKRLAEWIRSQRRNYKDKILSQDHIHLLNALGFDWVKSQ